MGYLFLCDTVEGNLNVGFGYARVDVVLTHLFLAALGGLAGFAAMQVDKPYGLAEKQAALKESVCWIPNGQTIDLDELPKETYRLDWMKKLKPELPISLVSIPATHDAGTALGNRGSTRCHVLTIPAQLAVGVRGFDIRLRLVESHLGIYHSDESQKVAFDAVLEAYKSFLTAHPSEFLVMRVREEYAAVSPTSSFEEAFARYTAPYSDLFYKAKSRTEIPTVGQLRGKILILDNYGKLSDAVDYPNATMAVQDDYETSDMAKKYREIVASFESARNRKDGAVWDVNYTSSCSLLVDQLSNAFAVNDRVRNYLKGKKGNLGLVLFNFPSVDVIHSVVDSNF